MKKVSKFQLRDLKVVKDAKGTSKIVTVADMEVELGGVPILRREEVKDPKIRSVMDRDGYTCVTPIKAGLFAVAGNGKWHKVDMELKGRYMGEISEEALTQMVYEQNLPETLQFDKNIKGQAKVISGIAKLNSECGVR